MFIAINLCNQKDGFTFSNRQFCFPLIIKQILSQTIVSNFFGHFTSELLLLLVSPLPPHSYKAVVSASEPPFYFFCFMTLGLALCKPCGIQANSYSIKKNKPQALLIWSGWFSPVCFFPRESPFCHYQRKLGISVFFSNEFYKGR